MKVLLVEDNNSDARLVQEYNKYNKAPMDRVKSLKEAVDKLKEKQYDCLLLDLILPDSEGLETLNNIKKQMPDKNKNCRIIVLTILDDYKMSRDALSMGAFDYIFKSEMTEHELKRALVFASYGSIEEDAKA